MGSKVLDKAKKLIEEELEKTEQIVIARFKHVARDWRPNDKVDRNKEPVKSLLEKFLRKQ